MQFDSLVEAINFKGVVAGLTHDFYRYPARFSPAFARDAIRLFTKPGDTILDPFMGSTTSLVEGMALGRNCVGIDISELAVFLAKVKTTVLSRRQAETLVQWAHKTAPTLSPSNQVRRHLHGRKQVTRVICHGGTESWPSRQSIGLSGCQMNWRRPLDVSY